MRLRRGVSRHLRRLLSTREIERFRNDLSWRYRIDRYIWQESNRHRQ